MSFLRFSAFQKRHRHKGLQNRCQVVVTVYLAPQFSHRPREPGYSLVPLEPFGALRGRLVRCRGMVEGLP